MATFVNAQSANSWAERLEDEGWAHTLECMASLDHIITELSKVSCFVASDSIGQALRNLKDAAQAVLLDAIDHWEVTGTRGKWDITCAGWVLGTLKGPVGFRYKREAHEWIRLVKARQVERAFWRKT